MATTRRDLASRLFGRRGSGTPRAQNSADAERFAGPIRGELLGAEGLAEHARALARQQRVAAASPGARPMARGARPLLNRLDETRQILESTRATLAAAVQRGADISPAGEWLLDNFYVIQEHLREIRASMPRGYYQELPKLAAGTLAGYPRVYEIAISLIGHTEGHVEMEHVQLFVREFQRGATLTTGELWAVPTMLRLGLMENIRRMALRTLQRLEEVEAADGWAERLRSASDAGAAPLATALASFVGGHPPLTPTFVARFLQQLRTYQTNFTPLVWLEQWIAEDSLSAEDAVSRSNQRLALTQVMMANSITSLRTIARLDWSAFVEGASAVEAVLRRDPTGDYPMMTFGTRDKYRHVVEDIAKGTGLEERDVAQRALELAQQAWASLVSAESGNGVRPAAAPGELSSAEAAALETARRPSHVGYYLVDVGRAQLEGSTRFQPPFGLRVHRWVLGHADPVYFGGITLLTIGLLAVAFRLVGPLGVGAQLTVLVFALIPANDIAISIMHQLVTVLLPPRVLPKLDFEDSGIPALGADRGRRAHLARQRRGGQGGAGAPRGPIPRESRSASAVRAPERLHRCDRHRRVRATAPFSTRRCSGIEGLNVRYPATPGQGDSFFLFHRHRLWNPRQGVWMGWERKRGKLAQFNRYLRGGARDAFSIIAGDARMLAERALRHHARLRHGFAARNGGHARRRHCASAESGDLRSGERPGRRGLRDSATAHRHHADECQPLTIRRDLLWASGCRSLHHCRLRRLSGSVRRRAATPGKASTMSTPSSSRHMGAFPRTRCSATT